MKRVILILLVAITAFATDAEAQYTAISAAKQKGYNVLLLDGQLDSPLVGMLEQKWEKARFVRVDSDTIERLIPQNNAEVEEVSEDDATLLSSAFKSVLPKITGAELHVEVANMSAEAMPVCITQSEYMRRMKDMSKLQEGMAFCGEMPDMYNLVLNANHPLVKDLLESMKHDTAGTVEPLMAELRGMRARQAALINLQNSKSDDAEAKEAAEQSKQIHQEISDLEQKRDEALASYATKQEKMSQLVDLALLSQGLLKGESLSQFINRSVDLLG